MREHAKAVITMLTAGSDVPVFDGEPPAGKDDPDIYVNVYVTTPQQENPRLSDSHSLRVYTVTTMSVGTSPNECRWAAEKVHERLTRKRPEVSGHTCSPMTLITAGQVRKDDKINPPAWIASDVWRFTSSI